MLGAVIGGVAMVLAGSLAWLYAPDRPRAELEARYATPPSSFVEIDGVRLHVRDTGPRDAPAIVLLHGFGASLQTWDGWAENLERDHRVIRYDQPGFGLTGADPSGDYSDTRSMAVLAGLMDRLGIARAAMIGHSMGGRIAWRFAASHPDRVTALVLVAPDGFASPGLAYGVAPKVPMMMRALPYVLPSKLLRDSLLPAYGDPAALTDQVFARYRDMMLAPGVRQAIVARMGQMVLADPHNLLPLIKAPVLLMWGDQDHMIPAENANDYMQLLPNARKTLFAGLGHLLHEESPDTTIAPLRTFLDEPR
jgi:pimeloyl-ACP methyl ester carboxylesterase